MSMGKPHDKDEEEEEPDDWNLSKKSSQMKRRSASSSDMSCRTSTPGTKSSRRDFKPPLPDDDVEAPTMQGR